MVQLDPGKVRRKTLEYWRLYQETEPLPRLRWYLDHLFPLEKPFIEKNRGVLSPAHTVVMLVGYSLEPLLQSLYVHQPKEVLLVVNRSYGALGDGVDWGRNLEHLVSKLQGMQKPDFDFATLEQGDHPEQVFQRLLRLLPELQKTKRSVAIDITGAKKNMVAGAYLFAAYAHIPVSYVDFDEFDPKHGRPFGYTCRVSELPNPYESFAIREWQEIKRLYEHYAFSPALERLTTVRDAMTARLEAGSLFDRKQIEAVNQLMRLLEIYARWDNGHFTAAWKLSQQLHGVSIPLPTAVEVLKDWPDTADVTLLLDQFTKLEQGPHCLHCDDERIRTYARDELAKVERLRTKQHDYRSALLRAAGLNEFLMKSRFLRLWYAGELGDAAAVTREGIDAGRQAALDVSLADTYGLFPIKDALQGKPIRIDNSLKRRGTTPALEPFWRGIGLTLDHLNKLRNKAIHTTLTATEAIAADAYRIVAANVCEFEKNWLNSTGSNVINVEAILWETICAACGIDFLPHLRLEDSTA